MNGGGVRDTISVSAHKLDFDPVFSYVHTLLSGLEGTHTVESHTPLQRKGKEMFAYTQSADARHSVSFSNDCPSTEHSHCV